MYSVLSSVFDDGGGGQYIILYRNTLTPLKLKLKFDDKLVTFWLISLGKIVILCQC